MIAHHHHRRLPILSNLFNVYCSYCVTDTGTEMATFGCQNAPKYTYFDIKFLKKIVGEQCPILSHYATYPQTSHQLPPPHFYSEIKPVTLPVLTGSGGATQGRARSNDLAGRSTALAQALAPPCLLLCFGNNMNRK